MHASTIYIVELNKASCIGRSTVPEKKMKKMVEPGESCGASEHLDVKTKMDDENYER